MVVNIPDAEYKTLITDIQDIKTALKGYNGYPGLCKSYEILAKDYYTFKRWAIGLCCFLVGTGVLGISLLEIIKGG
jgi:hypothetical protein